MSHGYHRPEYEESHRLDPSCAECCDKTLAELDNDYLRAILGFGDAEFRQLLNPTGVQAEVPVQLAGGSLAEVEGENAMWLARALALLRACRFAIRNANAMRIEREVGELASIQRWSGYSGDALPAAFGRRP